jgi:integration host factor subunit alpha
MYKKSLTKKDLANKINTKLGFSKNSSLLLVSDFFESVVDEIVKSKKIKITSFGTFQVFNKKSRIGRNPKTKKQFQISARNVVRFKPSHLIKRKINHS